MKKILLAGLLLVPCVSWSQTSQPRSSVAAGDYVEVRTASVFAGACHYNAELVTTGRDAIMAWNVHRGEWKGTSLDGVRAIAVVSSEANLTEKNMPHRSELIIDRGATEAQAGAVVEALKENYGRSLGEVIAVRRAPIAFEHQGRTYVVSAGDIAKLSVEGMPNDECCKMPNLVWYEPLAVPLLDRKVGYTKNAQYSGGKVADAWQRGDENSAFYGKFAMFPEGLSPRLAAAK